MDFHSLLLGMRIVDGQYTCITGTGRERIFEVNGHPLFNQGFIMGAVISARDITHEKGYEKDLQEILGNLRKSLDVTIKTITRTIDFKDPYTAGHQQRVSDLARAIATEMDLNFDTINGIRMAGIVHDIGKISIPSEILSKPGRLHTAERELIKIHPIIGFDILSSIDFPWPVAAAVLQHHERVDGSGYPYGITGDYILLDAKIIGVADVVEALATHRPYRASIGVTEALEEIEQKAGKNYDPVVVNACLRLFREKDYRFLA
jgi:HD-GYP domain-containing protein (c-di-GMP phosphodiesterase class II)